MSGGVDAWTGRMHTLRTVMRQTRPSKHLRKYGRAVIESKVSRVISEAVHENDEPHNSILSIGATNLTELDKTEFQIFTFFY